MACNLFHLDKWVLFRKLRQIWKSFFSFHACFDRMKFLLFYSLHMIAISVRSWRRRKLFSVSKKLIGQLGSLWGQACLRTAWSPLSDVFLISSFQIYSWCQPCRYPLSFPFQQVWVRCAQNSTLPTFGELNISSCCAFSRYRHVRHKFMCLLEQGPKQSIFCNISGFENFKPQGFVSKVFANEKFQIYERHTCGQA